MLLVRTIRDPGTSPEIRQEALLGMAVLPVAAIRQEALRQLTLRPESLDAGGLRRTLEALDAEIAGPADPVVLSAHMDLLEALRPAGQGQALAGIILSVRREAVAGRAGALLVEQGTSEDIRRLAGMYDDAAPAQRIRIVRTLGLRGDPEDLPVLAKALTSQDAALRTTAAAGLALHPAPAAVRILEGARKDPSAQVRQAALGALSHHSPQLPGAAAAGPARDDPGDPQSLGSILRSARRRIALQDGEQGDDNR